MGCPMCGSEDYRQSDWSRALYIPMPMAMFGVVVSCMFGMTVGLIMGKKHAAMRGMWVHGRDWSGAGWGKGGPGKGMMAHHHHGWGSSPCMVRHEQDAPAEESVEQAPPTGGTPA